ncbi:MAG: NAD(P)H-dependent oxidoreductase, partial [Bacteroidia bacterium]|nr:NAD(P)H-dependent oxidoreductase [Bacteroidia bacterium]
SVFANYAYKSLKEASNEEVAILDLADLGPEIIHEAMYKKDQQASEVSDIQDKYFIPSNKFWFFVPEYNGSIPGILKLLLDAISVRDYQSTFGNKKAAITGIASGRAGNLRGMDHLADILNHMNVAVLPNKQPISSIFNLIDENKKLKDSKTMECIDKQKVALLSF